MDIKDYTGYTIELEDSNKGCKIMSYKINKKKGRELKIKTHTDKSGYQRWVVKLINDEGKRKQLMVSRLILQHFKPNEWDEKLEADHIDINPLNNRIDNLRMLTHQQNCNNKSSKPNRDNKLSGHKNIHYDRRNKVWKFDKTINGLKYRKSFKTLNEAVKFKEIFFVIHNCS